MVIDMFQQGQPVVFRKEAKFQNGLVVQENTIGQVVNIINAPKKSYFVVFIPDMAEKGTFAVERSHLSVMKFEDENGRTGTYVKADLIANSYPPEVVWDDTGEHEVLTGLNEDELNDDPVD